MYRQSVVSSNVSSVGYDEDQQILEVQFRTGAIYQYYNVPVSIYRGLMGASSHGSFLNKHIKGVYGYNKV